MRIILNKSWRGTTVTYGKCMNVPSPAKEPNTDLLIFFFFAILLYNLLFYKYVWSYLK